VEGDDVHGGTNDDLARAAHVLVIVQNLPVPLDRRVWLECQALRDDGHDVSVICPQGPGDPARQVIDGVHLYKYRPPPAAHGLFGYALEFGYCWVRTAVLSRRVWRERPFRVMQACNPPDTYWLLARLWKRRGVRFVFDHHDLNPELFVSRPADEAAHRPLAQLLADVVPGLPPRGQHQSSQTIQVRAVRGCVGQRSSPAPSTPAKLQSSLDLDAERRTVVLDGRAAVPASA
jgi:hypothetical protein